MKRHATQLDLAPSGVEDKRVIGQESESFVNFEAKKLEVPGVEPRSKAQVIQQSISRYAPRNCTIDMWISKDVDQPCVWEDGFLGDVGVVPSTARVVASLLNKSPRRFGDALEGTKFEREFIERVGSGNRDLSSLFCTHLPSHPPPSRSLVLIAPDVQRISSRPTHLLCHRPRHRPRLRRHALHQSRRRVLSKNNFMDLTSTTRTSLGDGFNFLANEESYVFANDDVPDAGHEELPPPGSSVDGCIFIANSCRRIVLRLSRPIPAPPS
ncbi:hypothetical protein ONZ45_g15006 [Pleurotus djamor]|nr:hypothetical protein ONZ45_g15006 [Pleurotus djamor]